MWENRRNQWISGYEQGEGEARGFVGGNDMLVGGLDLKL